MAPRQQLSYRLQYAFNGDLERIEEWLENNCAGAYQFGFDGVKENANAVSQLQVLFSFELKEDRERFKRVIQDGIFNDS